MEQSWLCEFIMITNVRNGRSWFFPCNQWLSAYPPGDGLAVELFPNDQTLRDKPKRRKSAPETTGISKRISREEEKNTIKALLLYHRI